MDEVPSIAFAPARGGRIAWQRWGDGEDIVGVPPLAQNIELAWDWPAIRHMLIRFGQIGRYLHYDKRGTGASDRLRGVPGLDERVDDMRSVMDDAGIDRAHLFGNSDGGATALLFAATYPERVRSVILFGSGASTFAPDPSSTELLRRKVAFQAFVKVWGTRLSPWVDGFAPSLAKDQDFRRWHQRYERSCCDSETLLDLLRMSNETDVRDVCAQVTMPVLALHRRDDRIVDVARAEEVCALLPDARLEVLQGNDHIGYAGDTEVWLRKMERWITGSVTQTPAATAADGPEVEVITLGDFRVEVDGQAVPTSEWGSRHARTIVKRLAVAKGWPVTRDELFELLWPGERNRAKLGARLSVQLSTVRRILRGGVIADRDAVRLNLDEVTLDLKRFDDATDDGAVVASWTGPFLPGDEPLSWTAPARAAVAARFAAAAARSAEHALHQGRAGSAADTARRLLDADPLDLRGHELLVSALLDLEQPAAAADAHAAWVDAGRRMGVTVPPLEPA